MKFSNGLMAAGYMMLARFFNRRYPIAVGWELTHLCNHHCQYCLTCNSRKQELSTTEKLSIIDELRKDGCQVIAFTGGEALLVEDLPQLIDHARRLGIYVMLTSNGGLIPQRVNQLRNLHNVQLSLDGPREINDLQRERGMFDETMAAISVLKEHGIKTTLNCVITRINVGHVPQTLELAMSLGLSISFQPVAKNLTGLLPEPEKYRAALQYLIAEKRSGNRSLNQSLSILKHISDWPNEKTVPCAAGKIYCRIDPEGFVAPCNMLYHDRKTEEFNAARSGFSQAFHRMEPVSCRECWHHSRLDLNFLYNLDLSTIASVIRHQ